jgi:glycosyltransferase involved in cell wall biosynthesis
MSAPAPTGAIDRPDIAIFLPSLEGGGAERVMAILASGFVARGYRVDFVLAAASGPYLAGIDPRVGIVDLGSGSMLRSAVPLARYLRARRPRALLAALTHANVVALSVNRLVGGAARVVVSERLSLVAARRHHRSLHDRYIRALMRPTYRLADRVIVVAEAMIGELEEALTLPQHRLECIYNPVVDVALLAAADQPCAHPWMSAAADVPVVLGCGRLSAQKDFATLIEAFRRVRAHRPARLIILGQGEERAALEAQVRTAGIEHDVDLPGFAENPFAYMSRAAVFVLSSRYEGMPGRSSRRWRAVRHWSAPTARLGPTRYWRTAAGARWCRSAMPRRWRTRSSRYSRRPRPTRGRAPPPSPTVWRSRAIWLP